MCLLWLGLRDMDLSGEQTKLVYGENKETDVQQAADVERPWGEREGGNAGSWLLLPFHFLALITRRSFLGPQDMYVFVIYVTILKSKMA